MHRASFAPENTADAQKMPGSAPAAALRCVGWPQCNRSAATTGCTERSPQPDAARALCSRAAATPCALCRSAHAFLSGRQVRGDTLHLTG
eukprot:5763759-Prymnesium_polylepis.1